MPFSSWLNRIKGFPRNYLLGSLCAFLGASIFPICLVTAAMIPGCSPITVLFLQAYWTCAFSLCSITYNQHASKIFVTGEKRGVLLRALALTVASTTSYWAITYIPAGDVYALRFSNSIFVSLIGYLVLKEKFSKVQWLSVVGVVVGVFFVTKPSYIFGSDQSSEGAWIGILLSLTSCAFQAAEVLFLRTTPVTSTQVKIATSRLSLAIGCLILMIIRLDFIFPECGSGLIPLFAGLICIVLSSSLIDYASRFLKAGHFSIIRTSSVLFTYIYQTILLDLNPTWTSSLGATIISVFVVLSTLSEQNNHKHQQLSIRAKENTAKRIDLDDLPSTAV